MTEDPGRKVTVELTYDEALVLFAWTHRHEDEKYRGAFFVDHAEEVAVWNLTASLEPLIDEVLSPEFGIVTAKAKARLAREEGLVHREASE